MANENKNNYMTLEQMLKKKRMYDAFPVSTNPYSATIVKEDLEAIASKTNTEPYVTSDAYSDETQNPQIDPNAVQNKDPFPELGFINKPLKSGGFIEMNFNDIKPKPSKRKDKLGSSETVNGAKRSTTILINEESGEYRKQLKMENDLKFEQVTELAQKRYKESDISSNYTYDTMRPVFYTVADPFDNSIRINTDNLSTRQREEEIPIDENEEVIINIAELADHYTILELESKIEGFSLTKHKDEYNETYNKHFEIISKFKRNKNG